MISGGGSRGAGTIASRDAIARFHVDGVLFELVPASDPAVLSGRGNARLTLAVDQIESAAGELRAKGVPVSDPDGNSVTIHHRKAAPQ